MKETMCGKSGFWTAVKYLNPVSVYRTLPSVASVKIKFEEIACKLMKICVCCIFFCSVVKYFVNKMSRKSLVSKYLTNIYEQNLRKIK